jgi:hypothetical protein
MIMAHPDRCATHIPRLGPRSPNSETEILMTKRFRRVALVACACATLAVPATAQQRHPRACVRFEQPLVLGTTFGLAQGQKPGGMIFTENGIAVTVQNFLDTKGETGFGDALVDARLVPGGSRQSLRMNAISVRFDFTGLPYPAQGASFHYLDLGGSKDLAANDDAPQAFGIEAMPGMKTGGTSVNVAPDTSGTVTLSGPIRSLSVGGQKFWIDVVCAEP